MHRIYLLSQFDRIQISNIFVRKKTNICIEYKIFASQYSNNRIYLCYTDVSQLYHFINIIYLFILFNILEAIHSGFIHSENGTTIPLEYRNGIDHGIEHLENIVEKSTRNLSVNNQRCGTPHDDGHLIIQITRLIYYYVTAN